MKRFLSQVIERKENGLYFCRFPTGFGKSYNVREVIKDLLKSKDDRRKIIYLTPLKKNLPKELHAFVNKNLSHSANKKLSQF